MKTNISLIPLVNEKTYKASKEDNVYVFKTERSSTKHQIRHAVKTTFEVEVEDVHTLNVKGKAKRIISITAKRSVNKNGTRSSFKKAYVTLKEGSSLPFFEAVEESEEKQAKTQNQIEKAITKQNAKEDKISNKDHSDKRRFRLTKRPEGK